MDKLYTLIKKATEASPEFEFNMSYWVHKRNKVPDKKWLLEQLVIALGEETVIASLKQHTKENAND